MLPGRAHFGPASQTHTSAPRRQQLRNLDATFALIADKFVTYIRLLDILVVRVGKNSFIVHLPRQFKRQVNGF
jgi:hypothetical protein